MRDLWHQHCLNEKEMLKEAFMKNRPWVSKEVFELDPPESELEALPEECCWCGKKGCK